LGRLSTLDDWLNYQENLHSHEIDLGLERIQAVYQKLFPNGVSFKVITVLTRSISSNAEQIFASAICAPLTENRSPYCKIWGEVNFATL
jgi:hypothetical protein